MIESVFSPETVGPKVEKNPSYKRNLENVHTLLEANMRYKHLAALYNPISSLDEAERLRLTAKRVGLDMPKSFADALGEETKQDMQSSNKDPSNIKDSN